MAVFVSASDESSGGTHLSDFQCTGWLAPKQDWSRFFAPAWQERVLDGPPKLPYLHVTEMRSRAWRERHGITRLDAENRLDEAADIIATMGSLYPVTIHVKGSLFRHLFKKKKLVASTGARRSYEPDHYAFLVYAYAVLCRVKVKYFDAEKVDFIVENKSNVTMYVRDLYETLPYALRHIGRSDLLPLVGEFIPGSKERIPLQAADFLCWHNQRAQVGQMEDSDIRRWNPMAKKKGFSFDVPEELLEEFAAAWEEKAKENEALNRVRPVRQNDGRFAQGAAQRGQSKTRRRKGRNTKEKAEG